MKRSNTRWVALAVALGVVYLVTRPHVTNTVSHSSWIDNATGRVFYANIMSDHRTMTNVIILEPSPNSPFRQVTTGQTAVIEGSTLHLKDARVTRFKRTGEVDGFAIDKSIDVRLPPGEAPE